MSEAISKMESHIASIDTRLSNIETLLFTPFIPASSTTCEPVSALDVSLPSSSSIGEPVAMPVTPAPQTAPLYESVSPLVAGLPEEKAARICAIHKKLTRGISLYEGPWMLFLPKMKWLVLTWEEIAIKENWMKQRLNLSNVSVFLARLLISTFFCFCMLIHSLIIVYTL